MTIKFIRKEPDPVPPPPIEKVIMELTVDQARFIWWLAMGDITANNAVLAKKAAESLCHVLEELNSGGSINWNVRF